MKRIIKVLCVLAFFSMAVSADVRLPDTSTTTSKTKKNKAIETNLSIKFEKNAKEADDVCSTIDCAVDNVFIKQPADARLPHRDRRSAVNGSVDDVGIEPVHYL